jgi:putative transposase
LEKKIKNPFIHGKWMKRTSKIKGKWHYLYRAIDADGLTLDIWLRKNGTHKQPMLFLNG